MAFDERAKRRCPLLNSIKIKIFKQVIAFSTPPRICTFFMCHFIRFSLVCNGQNRTSLPGRERTTVNESEKSHNYHYKIHCSNWNGGSGCDEGWKRLKLLTTTVSHTVYKI